MAAVLARVPLAVGAGFSSVTVALVDITIEAACERAFVTAELALGSSAGTFWGGFAGLESIMCK